MNNKKDIYDIIRIRIKEERKKISLTQEELAYRAGVGSKFLSSIERGVSKPSLETFIKIVKALNITSDSLFINTNKHLKKIKQNNIDIIICLIKTLSEKQQKALINLIKNLKDL